MTERNGSPDPSVRAETEQLAGELAVELVHGGFTDFDEAVEALVETFDAGQDGKGGITTARATEIVTGVWSARLAEQEEWPEVTDADRVLAAFEALAEQDIVAEPHFACCRSCGLSEIGGYADEDSRGFVFFHQQDTDRAVAGGGLMLAYGGFNDTVERTTEVGHQVTAALTAAGLSVDWDGSPDRRIHVTPLEWRLRLAAVEA